MKAVLERITIPPGRRIICVSDIHGSLGLLERLLNKVGYNKDDILILLGDLYTRGKQGRETIRYIMELSENPGTYVLRGNCDWEEPYLTDAEKEWLNGLPHILETQDYIFVHGGLTSGDLENQDGWACMKNDAFMEQGLKFGKYVVTGHWPTANYTHKIPCCNPIVDEESRIISIDGGNVIRAAGQLNAFMMTDGVFSYDSSDDLPTARIERAQPASGGEMSVTWLDRFVEMIEDGGEFCLCRHLQSGKTISVPKHALWIDGDGRLGACDYTDYHLPVEPGDTVSVVGRFGGRMLAKKNGVVGWVEI